MSVAYVASSLLALADLSPAIFTDRFTGAVAFSDNVATPDPGLCTYVLPLAKRQCALRALHRGPHR